MKSKAHFNPKSATWVISLVIMIVLSVAVIFGSDAISSFANKKYDEHYEAGFTIASTQAVDISAFKADELGVTAVEKALDANGDTVAYIVTGTVIGYNAEVPIEMTTTVSTDGSIVWGVDILHQDETEYLGVRIETDEFKNQFDGRLCPVVSSKGSAKGSTIDVLARSTISSEAVIDGVNNAVAFLAAAGLTVPAE